MASRVVYSKAGKPLWVIVSTPETACGVRKLGPGLELGDLQAEPNLRTPHAISLAYDGLVDRRTRSQVWHQCVVRSGYDCRLV
jgi:hypothetical protein